MDLSRYDNLHEYIGRVATSQGGYQPSNTGSIGTIGGVDEGVKPMNYTWKKAEKKDKDDDNGVNSVEISGSSQESDTADKLATVAKIAMMLG